MARARSRASTSTIDVRSLPGRPFTHPGKEDGRERSDFSIAAFQIAGRDLPCLCNRYVRRWRLFSRGGPVYPLAFVRRGLAHVCIRASAISTLLPKTRVSGRSGQLGRPHGRRNRHRPEVAELTTIATSWRAGSLCDSAAAVTNIAMPTVPATRASDRRSINCLVPNCMVASILAMRLNQWSDNAVTAITDRSFQGAGRGRSRQLGAAPAF